MDESHMTIPHFAAVRLRARRGRPVQDTGALHSLVTTSIRPSFKLLIGPALRDGSGGTIRMARTNGPLFSWLRPFGWPLSKACKKRSQLIHFGGHNIKRRIMAVQRTNRRHSSREKWRQKNWMEMACSWVLFRPLPFNSSMLVDGSVNCY